MKGIEVRKELTDEWDRAGVKQGQQYALLTDIITREWSSMTTRQYKQYKGLKTAWIPYIAICLKASISLLVHTEITTLPSQNSFCVVTP